MKIVIEFEPVRDLKALGEVWSLLDETGDHSFFLTWTWIGSWLRSLSDRNDLLLVRGVVEGRTVGLGILSFRQVRFRGLFTIKQANLNATGDAENDAITIEHNGFACKAGFSSAMWAAFLSWFAVESDIDEIVLPGVSPTLVHSNAFLVLDREEVGFRCPLVKVRQVGKFDRVLTRNGRQQLARARRLLERAGPLRLEVAQCYSRAMIILDEMQDLHTRSWNRRGFPGAFANPFFVKFVRELVVTGIANGTVDLLRISVAEEAVGCLLNFRHGTTIYSYQSGFNDGDADTRPGYASHATAIDHYSAAGFESYDFLGKENRLKRSFGPEVYPLFWRRVRKPQFQFRAEALLRRLFYL